MDGADVADGDAVALGPIARARPDDLLQRHLPRLEPDAVHLEARDHLGVRRKGDLRARANLVLVPVGDDDDVDLGEVVDLHGTVGVGDEWVGQYDLPARRGHAEDRPGEPFDLHGIAGRNGGIRPDDAEQDERGLGKDARDARLGHGIVPLQ